MSSKKIKLDFCIITDPAGSPIIYLTKSGADVLDKSIVKNQDYESAIFLIQNFGYIESDALTFSFGKAASFPMLKQEKIIEILKHNGMTYSTKLEDFVNNKIIKRQKNSNLPVKAKHYIKDVKVPEVGEKITLYFYLFLEAQFINNQKSCIINFNGDFVTNQATDKRNYINIAKADFIRVNSTNNQNKIVFKCCKTNYDFFKDIPVTYYGSFENLYYTVKDDSPVPVQEQKTYIYKFMVIHDSIKKDNRITIEVERDINYNEMIRCSKRIKREQELFKRDIFVNLNSEIELAEETVAILKEKMLRNADIEEYEKAASIKKDIDYIESLKNKMHEMPIKMELYKYIKIFHAK